MKKSTQMSQNPEFGIIVRLVHTPVIRSQGRAFGQPNRPVDKDYSLHHAHWAPPGSLSLLTALYRTSLFRLLLHPRCLNVPIRKEPLEWLTMTVLRLNFLSQRIICRYTHVDSLLPLMLNHYWQSHLCPLLSPCINRSDGIPR